MSALENAVKTYRELEKETPSISEKQEQSVEISLSELFESYENVLVISCFRHHNLWGIEYENGRILFFDSLDPHSFRSPNQNTLYVVKTNIIMTENFVEDQVFFVESYHTLFVCDPLKDLSTHPQVLEEKQRKAQAQLESSVKKSFDIYVEGDLEPHTFVQLQQHLEKRPRYETKEIDRPFNKDIERLTHQAPRFFPKKNANIEFEAFPIPKRSKPKNGN